MRYLCNRHCNRHYGGQFERSPFSSPPQWGLLFLRYLNVMPRQRLRAPSPLSKARAGLRARDLAYVIECVFRVMAYESPLASAISADR
jgi:hypothetical protein